MSSLKPGIYPSPHHETPLHPPPKKLIRTGWDPKIVAERRKIFEGERFTQPTVTHTTVSSSAVVPSGWKQAWEHRLSKTDPDTAAAPTHAFSWKPRRRLSGRKWYSVADLRLSFKMASQHSLHPDIPGPQVHHEPIPPSPPRRNNKQSMDGPNDENASGTRKKRNNYLHTAPQSCPRPGGKDRLFRAQGQPTLPLQPSIRLQPTRPIDHLASLCIAHGSDFRKGRHDGRLKSLSQTMSRQDESQEQNALGCMETPYLKAVCPFLRPRVVSIKVSTISEALGSQRSGSPSQDESGKGSDVSNPPRVKALCKVFDKPQEPAVFYPFSEKGRPNAVPSKSRLSLPIMVSTTVAATTGSGPMYEGRPSGDFNTADRWEVADLASSSLAASRDGAADSRPRRQRRKRLRKSRPSPPRQNSPVKERIGLFEQLSCPTSTISLPANGRSKSYDHDITADKKRVPGFEFKPRSRLLRALSFGSRRGKSDKVKGKYPILSPQNQNPGENSSLSTSNSSSLTCNPKLRGEIFSFLQAAGSKRGTTSKLGESYPSPIQVGSPEREQSPHATKPTDPAVSSSLHMASNLNAQGSSPSLFHASGFKSRRILPARKSYGVLNIKPDWEDVEGTEFRNPFKQPASKSTSDSSGEPSSSSHPSTGPEVGAAASPAPRQKSRYPSSYGRKAGNSLKRGAARPVVSDEQAPAAPMRRSSRSLSWTKRAAAAAFAVGRRLREKGTNGRHHVSRNPPVGEAGTESESSRPTQRGSEEWDVFVATPSGGLQHPRPSRVVNMNIFSEEGVGEAGTRKREE